MTESDKELLELAAKAAGTELVWGGVFMIGPDEVDCSDLPYIKSADSDVGDEYWDPLTDDGDAFRLAVKLCFRLTIIGDGMCEVSAPDTRPLAPVFEHDANGDTCAATRRAVVLAAAAIGKEMT